MTKLLTLSRKVLEEIKIEELMLYQVKDGQIVLAILLLARFFCAN